MVSFIENLNHKTNLSKNLTLNTLLPPPKHLIISDRVIMLKKLDGNYKSVFLDLFQQTNYKQEDKTWMSMHKGVTS